MTRMDKAWETAHLSAVASILKWFSLMESTDSNFSLKDVGSRAKQAAATWNKRCGEVHNPIISNPTWIAGVALRLLRRTENVNFISCQSWFTSERKCETVNESEKGLNWWKPVKESNKRERSEWKWRTWKKSESDKQWKSNRKWTTSTVQKKHPKFNKKWQKWAKVTSSERSDRKWTAGKEVTKVKEHDSQRKKVKEGEESAQKWKEWQKVNNCERKWIKWRKVTKVQSDWGQKSQTSLTRGGLEVPHKRHT